jgi:hypothetical protein
VKDIHNVNGVWETLFFGRAPMYPIYTTINAVRLQITAVKNPDFPLFTSPAIRTTMIYIDMALELSPPPVNTMVVVVNQTTNIVKLPANLVYPYLFKTRTIKPEDSITPVVINHRYNVSGAKMAIKRGNQPNIMKAHAIINI